MFYADPRVTAEIALTLQRFLAMGARRCIALGPRLQPGLTTLVARPTTPWPGSAVHRKSDTSFSVSVLRSATHTSMSGLSRDGRVKPAAFTRGERHAIRRHAPRWARSQGRMVPGRLPRGSLSAAWPASRTITALGQLGLRRCPVLGYGVVPVAALTLGLF